MELLYIIFGFLLGLLAPSIRDRIDRAYRREDLVRTLLAEVRELQLKLASVAFRLRTRLGSVDVDFVEWLRPIVTLYQDPDQDPATLQATKELLSLPSAQVAAAAATPSQASPESVFTRLTPYSLPFLAAQVPHLAICTLDFQRRILDIQTQLEFYNGDVAFLQAQAALTFDPNVTGSNREAVLSNMRDTYTSASRRAESIARAITALLAAHSK